MINGQISATDSERTAEGDWPVDRHYIKGWLATLEPDYLEAVEDVIGKLEEFGPSLGRPSAAEVKESVITNLKELRPVNVNRDVMRILFAYAPDRTGVLLYGGIKGTMRRSNNHWWKKWYKKEAIPTAEERYMDYIVRHKLDDPTGPRYRR